MTNVYLSIPINKLLTYIRFSIDLKQPKNLRRLFGDIEFLEAIIVRLGIDELMEAFNQVLPLFSENDTDYQLLKQLHLIIRTESQNFYNASYLRRGSFVLQQMHNKAIEMNLLNIAKICALHLKQRHLSYLNLKWSTRSQGSLLTRTFTAESHAFSMAVTPNNKRLIRGDAKGMVQLWDLSTGLIEWSYTAHTDAVSKIVIMPDYDYAVSTSNDGSLAVWNLNAGYPDYLLTGHLNFITGVLVVPESKQVVSASVDGTIKFWDTLKGELLYTIEAHDGKPVSRIVDVPGRTWFASMSSTEVKFWNYNTKQQELTCQGHTEIILGLAIAFNGDYAFTISYDNTVRIWNLTSGQQEAVLPWRGPSGSFDDEFFTPVIKNVANKDWIIFTSDFNGNLEVWNYKTKQKISTLPKRLGLITDIVVLPDGQHVATAYTDTWIRIFELQTGRIKNELAGHEGAVQCLITTLDGKVLIASTPKTSEAVTKCHIATTKHEAGHACYHIQPQK